jgi:hypothetical protein
MRTTHAATCFDTAFPRVLGGTTGVTQFYSMDMDANGNIVIGGSTADSGVANLYGSPDPIIVFMERGNLYKWGINLAGRSYDRVGVIKFNAAGTKIFAALDTGSADTSPMNIAAF